MSSINPVFMFGRIHEVREGGLFGIFLSLCILFNITSFFQRILYHMNIMIYYTVSCPVYIVGIVIYSPELSG